MDHRRSPFSPIFERHTDVVTKSMQHILSDVERSAQLLVSALKGGKKILICGNGGSATDSEHVAAELSGRYLKERRALAAISLTGNTAALTAIANDYGYENVFSRQVEALGSSGDVLVAISTSGASKNILKVITAAKKKKMKVVVLTGAKGEKLRSKADALVAVPSIETARIQEVHQLVYHAWCEYIDGNIR